MTSVARFFVKTCFHKKCGVFEACKKVTDFFDTLMKGESIMSVDDISTLERIHSAAKAEFMEKGYRSSSLRSIVKAAGVTTGAFYGYYAGKQELFAALVDRSIGI